MPNSIAETVAHWATDVNSNELPEAVKDSARRSYLDVVGLCIAARDTDYVKAAMGAWGGGGNCSVIGHGIKMDAAGAAFINGTAAHGEDYDDTFEGTPVHTGAVAVPAILAVCEAHNRSSDDLIKGIAVAAELMCRMALVQPTGQHKAGFHPTAVIGAMGAAAGVGAALGLSATHIKDALGIAGSFASGIIEYLAEGAWTKRLHPGWAAQSGIRAALLGREGFLGPRTVFEGTHGFFYAFGVPDIEIDTTKITDGLGGEWLMANLAYKPYACGTMCQPFIDVARKMASAGIDPAEITEAECKVGEGIVHRLCEPKAEKAKPTTSYSAKFSVPYCIAVALYDNAAGLNQFTEERIREPKVLELAAKVNYQIDPENEYPVNYSGHLRVVLKNGSIHEIEQPHLRGGVKEPLSDQELSEKFHANATYGGWPMEKILALEKVCNAIFQGGNLENFHAFEMLTV
jgi:2-methylcitrate dehydratase PrpD